MASTDCTESGARLWMALLFVFTVLYTIEIVVFTRAAILSSELIEELSIITILISFGTVTGTVFLHQGLTNGAFLASIRTAFVSIGSVISVGSLLAGGLNMLRYY